MRKLCLRGPLLVPKSDRRAEFFSDGVIVGDERIDYVGDWKGWKAEGIEVRRSRGIMLPPLVDLHIHIPQHVIRGRFTEGVAEDAPGGKLLAGLKRNVFPAEARCNAREEAVAVTRAFLADTLSHGVVGGAAYMTPSAQATEAALEILPQQWRVGLVLMNQRCPEDLRTDEANVARDHRRLAERFGDRLIVTDRFAVAVDTPLRKRAARLAMELGLRTQTHLNEQVGEKALVERELYPEAASYTDVYRRDGLLDSKCILAHCIHMRESEWRILAEAGAAVAHCPTSNELLGSGVMALEPVRRWKIPYAIATDMGAAPTVSMLAEMRRFLNVHPDEAMPAEALWRATAAPAEILGLDMGILQAGRAMSLIEVLGAKTAGTAEEVIEGILPHDLANPAKSTLRVTLAGKTVFEREVGDA